MKTTLTIALIATLSFAVSAQLPAAHPQVAKQAGLAPGAPFVLYLGDVDGTPFEVLMIGQVPAAGERRLRLPEFRSDVTGLFLAVEGDVYQVARERDLDLDNIRPSDMGKKSQQNIGRIKHQIVAQAPSPTLGGNHDVFSPDQPVDEPPFVTEIEKKGQWVIGRIHTSVDSATSAAGAALGNGSSKVLMGGQLGDLGVQGDAGSGHSDVSGVIECPWGGPDAGVDVAAAGFSSGAMAPGLGTAGGASLGGTGSLADADQGLDTNNQFGHRRGDVNRGGVIGLQGGMGAKEAVEVINLAQPTGSNASLGGQVMIRIAPQGLGLLVER